jgi:hypothetical protein
MGKLIKVMMVLATLTLVCLARPVESKIYTCTSCWQCQNDVVPRLQDGDSIQFIYDDLVSAGCLSIEGIDLLYIEGKKEQRLRGRRSEASSSPYPTIYTKTTSMNQAFYLKNCSDVFISGFNFDGFYTGIGFYDSSKKTVPGLRTSKLTFKIRGQAIRIREAPLSYLSGLTVMRASPTSVVRGIEMMKGCDKSKIEGSMFIEPSTGIYVSSSDTVNIRDVEIIKPSATGIYATEADGLKLQGISIERLEYEGIHVEYSDNIYITSAIIGKNPNLKDELFVNTSTNGIVLQRVGGKNYVSSCSVFGQDYGIHLDPETSGVQLRYSNFCWNAEKDIQNDGEGNTGKQNRCNKDRVFNWRDEGLEVDGCTFDCKLYGDANLDCELNDDDLILMREFIDEITEPIDDQFENCNMTPNSFIDETDYNLLEALLDGRVLQEELPIAVWGDVNGDGLRTGLDASIMGGIEIGQYSVPEDISWVRFYAGDLQPDKKATYDEDVVLILCRFAEKINDEDLPANLDDLSVCGDN